MRVLLGVTGGVAAFKSASILRLIKEQGHEVRVVATENALRFIGETTLANLSQNKVGVDLYQDTEEGAHIELAEWADKILIAPATASLISRLANGMATDLLTNVVLASSAEVTIAPAMHSNMFLNQATQENLQRLSHRGVQIIQPSTGRLAGSDSGIGRLPEPEEIVAQFLGELPLRGLKAVVTLGGTQEPIDSVRFIGNRSTGKQGLAFANALRNMGADVHVIAANTNVDITGFENTKVSTFEELQIAMRSMTCDFLVMAAAVSDFRVLARENKLNRENSLTLKLEPTEDLVANYKKSNPSTKILAFSVTDESNWQEIAREKRISKKVEYVFGNQVEAFGADESSGVLIADGEHRLDGSKHFIAQKVLELISEDLKK